MDMDSLSKMILSNPDMLKDLNEDDLCEMVGKMNPYSKVVGGSNKQVLFSFTNFKEDRMMAYKTLSMSQFLSQLIDEEADWSGDLKQELDPAEMD